MVVATLAPQKEAADDKLRRAALRLSRFGEDHEQQALQPKESSNATALRDEARLVSLIIAHGAKHFE